MPALAIGAATGGIELATPSQHARADIPPDYLLLYQQAGLAFDVPWQLLAGIGKVECDHGRNPDPACWQEGAVNEAGAGGPMQFLASTWASYGLDGDNDGTTDRWDAADAIVSAANYLKASGAPDDLAGAVLAYNHSQAYMQQVLAWASRYASGYGSNAAAAESPPPELGAPMIGDARALADAVLASPKIALRPEAERDVRGGRVDQRVLAVLLALSERFALGCVGPIVTGHAYYVSGTTDPSNHAFGRAVDIGCVDGSPVSQANGAAREAAAALASLPARLRPDEVGSPFAELDGVPGFFSDADHQDHIHVGFDGTH